MNATESEARDILTTALNRWGAAVATGDTARIADLYTATPVFQGLRPGPERDRAGVADYYAHQPIGLTPTFTPLDVRALGEHTILAFLAVDFAAPGRPVVATHLTVLLTRVDDEWLIEHYHV
ncbi:ketosteroid isomerase-like protein [Mycetocola sp. BIGb0189]|uniref:nuclear transport factor 2 family protein n=1 Tax=Mycetocola sp. BIGb0189 TaxID=2940604 RepID=UPI0021690933|nr:nuclear transport factor 2 family protein [Mycetocola sp. BIGb0189]MCS4275565.1 ketosteroid isomerase-like protein [Mycetocola sp. BIGb0189]